MDCACTKGLSSTNKSAQGLWSPRSRELLLHFPHFLTIQNHFPLCFHPLPKIRPASAKAQMLPFISAFFSENFKFYPWASRIWSLFALEGQDQRLLFLCASWQENKAFCFAINWSHCSPEIHQWEGNLGKGKFPNAFAGPRWQRAQGINHIYTTH